jgi:hypothetical protein
MADLKVLWMIFWSAMRADQYLYITGWMLIVLAIKLFLVLLQLNA